MFHQDDSADAYADDATADNVNAAAFAAAVDGAEEEKDEDLNISIENSLEEDVVANANREQDGE